VTFLAQVFADLADDPSWPTSKDRLKLGRKYPELRTIYCGTLDTARLALMVVEEHWRVPVSSIDHVLSHFRINPDHYANVKKRFEEADTEENEKLR